MDKQNSKLVLFLRMALTLVVIALLSAFILAKVQIFTKEPIQKAKDSRQLEAISAVVNEFDNNPFDEKMIIYTPGKKHKLELYPARKEGVVNSFAVKTYSNAGFGGRLELIVGFYIDGSIKGFRVIEHHETPGLGSKINEPRFQEQFNGFNPNKQKFKVRQDGGEIDAVTAATISSRAVINAVQRAVDAYNNFNTGN